MSNYIKELRIKGYKKFKDFTIQFNKHNNILIGENSVGKTTILEAIEIVLNQRFFKFGNENFQHFLNLDNVNEFFSNPKLSNLPNIEIEIYLNLDSNLNNSNFNGEHCNKYDEEPDQYNGIRFTYCFDDRFDKQFQQMDFQKNNRVIPVDYYTAKWTMFSGNPYKSQMSPLKNLLIDNSNYMNNMYGTYTKKIYEATIDDKDKRELSFKFKNNIESLINDELLTNLNNRHNKFAFNDSKLSFKDLLDIKNDGISIQSMGGGQENIIKTTLALNTKNNLSTIMIEEPENHLSYSNTKRQIANIDSRLNSDKQLIITTHESMVLNKLSLKNAIFVNNKAGFQLKDLNDADVIYFEKDDDFNILKFILADKVILVEGASEFILMDSLVRKSFPGYNLASLGITVISLGGIHYNHFIDLGKKLNKKVLILTDNDGNEDKIKECKHNNKYNNKHINIKMPNSINEFTLEAAFYYLDNNEELFKQITPKRASTTSFKSYKKLPIPLAYSLNHKTDNAIKFVKLIEDGESVSIPDYIKEGLQWLEQS